MRVYLAGPITGLTYREGQDWRSLARELFPENVEVLSPLRGKEYLEAFGKLLKNYHGAHPLSEPRGIVTRDRHDVQTSDVILMNLQGAERVSIGTMIELGWADSARVPVIVITDQGNIHDHEMVHGLAGYEVESLEEGVFIACAVLGTHALEAHGGRASANV